MTDIYTRFNLSGPPPPTIFSRNHGPNRARLPNFTRVDEVSAFIDDSILWRHSSAADICFLVFITYTVTLEVAMTLYIAHQIWQRRWWLFRIVNRGHSRFLVPNVHVSWTVFIGIFGWVLVTSWSLNYVADKRREPIKNNGLWIGLMWSPIPLAAWYQAWGIAAARLDNLMAPGKPVSSWCPAWIINIVCFCFPLAPAVAVIAPCILCNSAFERARLAWYDWNSTYGQATELSRDMLVDAQYIWIQTLQGCYYVSITMAIWAATIVIFAGLYAVCASLLILDLRKSLRVKKIVSTRPAPESNIALNSITSTEESDQADGAPQRCAKVKWAVEEKMAERPSASTMNAAAMRSDGPTSLDGFARKTIEKFRRPGTRGADAEDHVPTQGFSQAEVAQDLAHSYFPPVKPSRTVTSLGTRTAKKLLFQFQIQTASVVYGGIGYLIATLYFVIGIYAAAERNEPEHVEIVGFALASTVSIFFGTTSIFSITQETFEASFTSLLHGGLRSEAGSRLRRRSTAA